MKTTRRGFLASAAAAVGVGGLVVNSAVTADGLAIPGCSGGKHHPPAWSATIKVDGCLFGHPAIMQKETDNYYLHEMMFFLGFCIPGSVPRALAVALRDHIIETWHTAPFDLEAHLDRKDNVLIREWASFWRKQTEYVGSWPAMSIAVYPEGHKIVVTERRNRAMVPWVKKGGEQHEDK